MVLKCLQKNSSIETIFQTLHYIIPAFRKSIKLELIAQSRALISYHKQIKLEQIASNQLKLCNNNAPLHFFVSGLNAACSNVEYHKRKGNVPKIPLDLWRIIILHFWKKWKTKCQKMINGQRIAQHCNKI